MKRQKENGSGGNGFVQQAAIWPVFLPKGLLILFGVCVLSGAGPGTPPRLPRARRGWGGGAGRAPSSSRIHGEWLSPRPASLRHPPGRARWDQHASRDTVTLSHVLLRDIFLGTLSQGLSLAREGTATPGQKPLPLECVLLRPPP